MHPEPFKSPYPRHREADAIDLPSVTTRLAADSVALLLGACLALLPLTSPYTPLHAVMLGVAGVTYAVSTDQNGRGRAWQTIGVGVLGVTVGAAFNHSLVELPYDLSDYFIWYFAIGATCAIAAGICWLVVRRPAPRSVERCDAYQAFRRAVGLHVYLVPSMYLLLTWQLGFVVPLVLSLFASLLLWLLMRFTVPRNLATRGAVYAYLWTPMLPLLTLLTITNATLGRASIWVAITILLGTTIALTIFAPRWRGERACV